MRFTGWKDKTAIEVGALIALADQVVQTSSKHPGSVLIHCSHGVGRTGTLITFIAASEMLANALKNRRGMLIGELMQLVTEIVVRGRIERGPDLVSANQFPSVLPEMTWFHR